MTIPFTDPRRAGPIEASTDTRARGSHIVELLAFRGTPRNQVASLSGLTNTYIRDLEGDRILNVPRDNLIALGSALNLKLDEIDDLLRRFDRSPLNEDDIPTFLALPDRMELSNAVHPCHNVFYELTSIGCQRRSKRLELVTDRPAGALRPPGFRTHFNRRVPNPHSLNSTLVEAIGALRNESLLRATQQPGVTHYVSFQGLKRYVQQAGDQEDAEWRRRHVLALADLVEQRPCFQLHLTNTEPNFAYTLYRPSSESKSAVLFEGQAASGVHRSTLGRLTGFATTHSPLVDAFVDDLLQVQRTIIEKYHDRQALHDLLIGIGQS